jgi:hypothetical protein
LAKELAKESGHRHHPPARACALRRALVSPAVESRRGELQTFSRWGLGSISEWPRPRFLLAIFPGLCNEPILFRRWKTPQPSTLNPQPSTLPSFADGKRLQANGACGRGAHRTMPPQDGKNAGPHPHEVAWPRTRVAERATHFKMRERGCGRNQSFAGRC